MSNDTNTQAPDVGALIEYENGELDARGTVDLFAGLIRSGLAWSLQGHYGRTAAGLIDAGLIDAAGTIDHDALDARLDS
jgi:hypothetical protein